MDRIKTILSLVKAQHPHAFELRSLKTEAWEFYFIRHALDQNRVVNTEHLNLTIYETTDDCKTIGSASMEIPLTASEAEIAGMVKELSYRATLVKNAYYTLTPPAGKAQGASSPEHADGGNAAEISLEAISRDFIETMNSLPETDTEDINSYEIFVRRETSRLLTSTGIDITEVYPSSMIEVIVNARKDGHEIELYRNYTGGTCDREALKTDLSHTLQRGKDRLLTEPTPSLGKVDVVFSTEDILPLYDYFLDRLDPAMVYRHLSDWEIGTPIAEEILGDKVTVETVLTLPNSSENRAYDREGAPIREARLLDASVPAMLTGARMFSCYMGLEGTFIPANVVFSGGTKTEEEIRSGAYLEAVAFSDFQVDVMTGDIFGEIRLGYLHDGNGGVRIVSGGSLSGSMDDFVKTLALSKKQVQYDNYVIPALTRLKDVTLAGAGE